MIQAPFWSQGLNAYAYAFNNPINVVDPTGLAGKWEQTYGQIDSRTGAFDAGFVDSDFNEARLVVFGDDQLTVTKQPSMAVSQPKHAEAKEQAATEQQPTNDQADTEKNTQPSQPGTEAPKPATGGGTAAGGQTGSAGGGNKGGGKSGGGGKPGPSVARAVGAGASGAALGLGMGIGTMYATGAAGSLVCGPAAPACAAAVTTGITAALVGVAIYQLWNGGAAQIGDAAQRLSNGEGTEADYFMAGSVLGGLASGRFGSSATGAGATGGLRARAIVTGGGSAAAGDISGAGAGAGAADVVHHYTTRAALPGIRKTGLWSQSSATDIGTYTAQEAMELLGVKTAPEIVIEFQNSGRFIPNKPAIVQPHPLGTGGGLDLINPAKVPPECIVCVRPVKP